MCLRVASDNDTVFASKDIGEEDQGIVELDAAVIHELCVSLPSNYCGGNAVHYDGSLFAPPLAKQPCGPGDDANQTRYLGKDTM